MSFRNLLLLISASAAACDSGVDTRVVDGDDEVDEAPPVISHTNDPSPRTFGVEVFIGATVTDVSSVSEVKVVFQRETDGFNWTELRMAPLTTDYWEGVIPGNDVSSGGIRYYIEAIDEFDNSACLPEACQEEAWHFPVVRPR
jgi:hypothetical protein